MRNKLRNLWKDGDFRELFRGGRSAFLINLAGMAIGYLFIFLVSRIFLEDTATIYGQYVLFTLFVKLLAIGCKFGLDTLTMKMTSEFLGKGEDERVHVFFKKAFRLMAGTTGIVLMFYYLTLVFWEPYIELSTFYLVLIGVTTILFSFRYLYAQFLRGYKRVAAFSFLTNFSVTALNAVTLLLFWGFYTFVIQKPITVDILIGTFILSVFITVIFSIFLKKRLSAKQLSTNKKNINSSNSFSYKSILKSSYPFSFTESMIFLSVWTDQLMLGFLGTAGDVGIFNVCMKYVMLTSLSLRAVNVIAAPKFADAYGKKDYNELSKFFKQSLFIVTLTSLPIIIVYFIFPEELLGVFGEEFIAGKLAFIILLVGAILNLCSGSIGQLLLMTGKQYIVQNILIIIVIAKVIANIILIPEFGINGAAITSVLGIGITNSLFIYYSKNMI